MTLDRTAVIARAETLRPMLKPRAVAVLGASDDATKIGGVPLRYFRELGYQGAVYAVNPTRDTVQGLPAYKSVTDIEGPVDMAIMAVPARIAVETAEQAAEKGVKSLCTFTSGFSEIGEEGQRMQQRLREIARDSGMRILGPNCLGYFNARNHVYATFMDDYIGAQALKHWGDRNCMWSSDYPHPNMTWPNSRAFLAKRIGDLDPAKQTRVLSQNVIDLYGLEL